MPIDNILDLPDDVLIQIFKSYLSPLDLINVSNTCKKFKDLIEDFSLWSKFINRLPLLDYNYPYGNFIFLIAKKHETRVS